LNAVPIREAIPVADPAQGLQDQAVLVLGDHPDHVRVDLVVLVMMIGVVLVTGLLVVILGIEPRVGMTAVQMIVRLAVTLVIVRRVGMIVVVLMIGLLVATAQALVGPLVRDVMTVAMVGDEAVPVKKILLPASRVMRPSGGVQQFVPAVLVPFVRT